MRLDEFYTVIDDGNCWTLAYEKEGDVNPKTGKPTISRDASYHANLKQALTAYFHKNLAGDRTWQEIIDRMNEIEKRIEQIGTKTQAAMRGEQ